MRRKELNRIRLMLKDVDWQEWHRQNGESLFPTLHPPTTLPPPTRRTAITIIHGQDTAEKILEFVGEVEVPSAPQRLRKNDQMTRAQFSRKNF